MNNTMQKTIWFCQHPPARYSRDKIRVYIEVPLVLNFDGRYKIEDIIPQQSRFLLTEEEVILENLKNTNKLYTIPHHCTLNNNLIFDKIEDSNKLGDILWRMRFLALGKVVPYS